MLRSPSPPPPLSATHSPERSPLPLLITLPTLSTKYRVRTALPSMLAKQKRPVLKRIKEHESNFHNNTLYDTDGKMKSAPAIHAKEKGHTMDWNSTQILATAPSRTHLNLLEQAYIHTLQPTINRTDKVPAVNQQWNPLMDRIATAKPRQAGIKIKPRTKPPKTKKIPSSTS